jgi:hypothetical protein
MTPAKAGMQSLSKDTKAGKRATIGKTATAGMPVKAGNLLK